MNFYAYADGDPLDLSDPFGLSTAPAVATLVRTALRLIPGGAGGVTVSGLSWAGFSALLGTGAALGAEAAIADAEVDLVIAQRRTRRRPFSIFSQMI